MADRAMAPLTQTALSGAGEARLDVSVEALAAPAPLADHWRALAQRSEASFFQSWAWIGCWLRHLPASITPQLLSLTCGSDLVGLGLLVPRRVTRHGVLRLRGLYLNETGDPRVDSLGLEYNGLLLDRRVPAATAARRCLVWLAAQDGSWDELNLGGLDRRNAEAWIGAARDLGLRVRLRAKQSCDFVDLAELRRTDANYLAGLGRNTRQQIRRAMRLYERHGPLDVEAAASLAQANAVLDELRELHQAYWTQKGERGAFARGRFEAFHRDLIAAEFDAGRIQLLRMKAGKKTVGCLYNFVHKGWVHAYQSGFHYESDARLKPGLVSHCLAIEHNRARGALVYDFMAGPGRHKRSLGNAADRMSWLTLQRPRARLQVERALQILKGRTDDSTPAEGTEP